MTFIGNLVEEIKSIYPDNLVRRHLLTLASDFYSHYYGLGYLVRLIGSNRCVGKTYHGGHQLISVFDPSILLQTFHKIILDNTLTLDRQEFALKALYSTDVDYLVSTEMNFDKCHRDLEEVVQILNRKSGATSNEVELFTGYFLYYYLQKNCNQKIKFGVVNLNNEVSRLTYYCGHKQYSILDLYFNDNYRQYISKEPIDVLITDITIILNELINNPSKLQLEKGQKRLFRFNFFFSLLEHNFLNNYEFKFGLTSASASLSQNDLKDIFDKRFSLIDLWNQNAKTFYNGQWLTIDKNGKLFWSQSPIILDENIVVYDPKINRLPFKLENPSLGKLEIDATRRYFDELPSSETLSTGVAFRTITNVIRNYTGNYYFQLNSCLYNYLYDFQQCNPEILHNCLNVHHFIKYFSETYNDRIFNLSSSINTTTNTNTSADGASASTDTDLVDNMITLYRGENNVSLGLPGGYYSAQIGDQFINAPFWSTTYADLPSIASGKPIILEIKLDPKICPVLIVEPLSKHGNEKEVLLPFGCIFEITGRKLISYKDHDYTLIKLTNRGCLEFRSMSEYYQTFHRRNYAMLPNESIVPTNNMLDHLTCQKILSVSPLNFRKIFNAYYSRTLPIDFKNMNGKTALILAANNSGTQSSIETVMTLISAGAHFDLNKIKC